MYCGNFFETLLFWFRIFIFRFSHDHACVKFLSCDQTWQWRQEKFSLKRCMFWLLWSRDYCIYSNIKQTNIKLVVEICWKLNIESAIARFKMAEEVAVPEKNDQIQDKNAENTPNSTNDMSIIVNTSAVSEEKTDGDFKYGFTLPDLYKIGLEFYKKGWCLFCVLFVCACFVFCLAIF